jgi:WXG100 protein secretion system (Wss), protein YukD
MGLPNLSHFLMTTSATMALIAVAGSRLMVSVKSPSGTRLVSLPEEARVEDVLPNLVRMCEGGVEPAGWTLAPQGEALLKGGQTLAEVGLFSGAVLLLAPPEQVPMEARIVPAAAPPPPRIDSMGEADYVRMLEAAIATRHAPSSRVIAVVAGHPGAGATTVASLLATALSALREDSLAAVDANPESGALSHWLVPDGALAAELYQSLFAPEVSPREVGRALVVAGPRLAVLPAPLDPTRARSGDVASWERLIEHLRHMHHTVVVDCGAGMQRDAVRAVTASTDVVVLVNTYDQPPRTTRRLDKPVVLVANLAARRTRMRQVEAGVWQVTIAAEPRAAASLKRRGFTWSEAPPAWQEAVRELAALLVAGA